VEACIEELLRACEVLEVELSQRGAPEAGVVKALGEFPVVECTRALATWNDVTSAAETGAIAMAGVEDSRTSQARGEFEVALGFLLGSWRSALGREAATALVTEVLLLEEPSSWRRGLGVDRLSDPALKEAEAAARELMSTPLLAVLTDPGEPCGVRSPFEVTDGSPLLAVPSGVVALMGLEAEKVLEVGVEAPEVRQRLEVVAALVTTGGVSLAELWEAGLEL
jgi:hypothetical protein